MITGVLFDLDETLLDRTGSIRDFVAYQHSLHPSLAQIKIDQFVDRFLFLDQRGLVPKSQVYKELLQEIGITDQHFIARLVDEYEQEFCRFARCFPGLTKLFDGLRERKLRTGIVTNGQVHLQMPNIKALELDRKVDSILISESEGVRKPDLEIFMLAASRIGSNPENCVFVGDSPTNDIVGAKSAGMGTIWFPNGAIWPIDTPEKPDMEAHSLDEILYLLCEKTDR